MLQVVLAAAEMLGALSPLRLAALGQRWEAELGKLIRADANSPARQQLYDLCHGMRFVRISGASNVQVGDAGWVWLLCGVHAVRRKELLLWLQSCCVVFVLGTQCISACLGLRSTKRLSNGFWSPLAAASVCGFCCYKLCKPYCRCVCLMMLPPCAAGGKPGVPAACTPSHSRCARQEVASAAGHL
jgi:hypothetical protein